MLWEPRVALSCAGKIAPTRYPYGYLLAARGRHNVPGSGRQRPEFTLEFAVDDHRTLRLRQNRKRPGQRHGGRLAALNIVNPRDGVAFDEKCLARLDLDGDLLRGRLIDLEGGIGNRSVGPDHAKLELELLSAIRIRHLPLRGRPLAGLARNLFMRGFCGVMKRRRTFDPRTKIVVFLPRSARAIASPALGRSYTGTAAIFRRRRYHWSRRCKV